MFYCKGIISTSIQKQIVINSRNTLNYCITSEHANAGQLQCFSDHCLDGLTASRSVHTELLTMKQQSKYST